MSAGAQVDFDDIGLPADTDREVRGILADWERERQRLCQTRMALAAKEGGERRMLRSADGNGGEISMMVDPYSYHYWGQRLGYQCWSDREFCREYLRDNPEARVHSVPDAPTVLVKGAGGLASTGARRFHKAY